MKWNTHTQTHHDNLIKPNSALHTEQNSLKRNALIENLA